MPRMKRYLAWAGEGFYACGPIADFLGDFDRMEDLEPMLLDTSRGIRRADAPNIYDTIDWVRVLDTDTGQWIINMGGIYGDGQGEVAPLKWPPTPTP